MSKNDTERKSDRPVRANITSETEDEINLLAVMGLIWREKVTVISITAVFAVLSVVYALSLPNIFRAHALLLPVSEDSSMRFSQQLGLAANFTGIDIGSSSGKTQASLATLQSREFINQFIHKHELLPWLFASRYQPSIRASTIDSNIYNTDSGEWNVGNSNSASIPTNWEAYETFSGALTVSENQGTGLITLSLEWIDPGLAASWLNLLIADANDYLRDKDTIEATESVDFLQDQLESTQLLEMQRMLYQLIESQMRTLMLADAKEGYAFEVIDPAVAPENKSRPRRSIICISITFLGAMLSVVFVLARNAWAHRS